MIDHEGGSARVDRAVAALRRLFQRRPAGLLTDVDGTISRITQRTEAATVSPSARRSLAALASELDVVAVVTGRAVARASQMVGVPELAYVGNHGLEWLHGGTVETHPAGIAARPALDALLAAIRAEVPQSGLQYEDKGASVAIHYRLSPDPEAARVGMLAQITPFVERGELRLIEGGFVVNVLPAAPVDKGDGVRRLVERYGLRAVAFFGDDVTDLDAFRMVARLRAAGQIDGLTVGVDSPEGPPAVRAEADLVLDGVGEVERVLELLAASPRG